MKQRMDLGSGTAGLRKGNSAQRPPKIHRSFQPLKSMETRASRVAVGGSPERGELQQAVGQPHPAS